MYKLFTLPAHFPALHAMKPNQLSFGIISSAFDQTSTFDEVKFILPTEALFPSVIDKIIKGKNKKSLHQTLHKRKSELLNYARDTLINVTQPYAYDQLNTQLFQLLYGLFSSPLPADKQHVVYLMTDRVFELFHNTEKKLFEKIEAWPEQKITLSPLFLPTESKISQKIFMGNDSQAILLACLLRFLGKDIYIAREYTLMFSLIIQLNIGNSLDTTSLQYFEGISIERLLDRQSRFLKNTCLLLKEKNRQLPLLYSIMSMPYYLDADLSNQLKSILFDVLSQYKGHERDALSDTQSLLDGQITLHKQAETIKSLAWNEPVNLSANVTDESLIQEIQLLKCQLQEQQSLLDRISCLKAERDSLSKKINALRKEKISLKKAYAIPKASLEKDSPEAEESIESLEKTQISKEDLLLLASKKIVIIGGHDHLHKSLQEDMPNWVYYKPNSSIDTNVLDHADLVCFMTHYLKHMTYRYAKAYISQHKNPLIRHCNNNNKQLIYAIILRGVKSLASAAKKASSELIP